MRALIAALVVVGSPAVALACDPFVPDPWELDPAEVGIDTTAPTAARLKRLQVIRAVQPLLRGGPTDSCGDGDGVRWTGELRIDLLPGRDDRTVPDRIGYRVQIDGARPPPDLARGTGFEPIEVLNNGRITFWWDDPDSGEPLDFRVRLTPLDAAGNEGPTLDIPVHDDGAGCSAASGGAALLPLLVVVGFLARRPRPLHERQRLIRGWGGRASARRADLCPRHAPPSIHFDPRKG